MKILCFNIDEDFIKYGICNENYELVETHKTPKKDYNNTELIILKITDIINSYTDIDKVAISIDAWVNSDGASVCSPEIFGDSTPVYLKKQLEEKTNIKTFVENSVNSTAVTLSEFGKAKGEKNFICLSYGKKVKAAIFIDGNLYKGSNNAAGEIGYITNASEIGSTDGLIWVICNLIYVLNPPLIVLDSKTSNMFSVDEIKEKLQSILPEIFINTRIITSSLSNDAALIGAAFLANN